MIDDNVQKVIDFAIRIDWPVILNMITGALIAAALGYLFAKKREAQLLKINIQIETAEQLINAIKSFNNKSAIITSLNYSPFKIYNLTIDYKQNIMVKANYLQNSTDWVDEYNRRNIARDKENINKFINHHTELWEEYLQTFFSITSILESKEVILNRFVGFRLLLLYEIKGLSKTQSGFMNFYYSDISNKISMGELINDVEINKIDNYESEFMEKFCDISCIMYDLQVALQNEFLSKIFKYSVKMRQPQNEDLPVYKAGFIYDKETE